MEDLIGDVLLGSMVVFLLISSMLIGLLLLTKGKQVCTIISFPPKFFYAFLTLLFWLILVVIAFISMLTGVGEAVIGILLFLWLCGQSIITSLWLRANWLGRKAKNLLTTLGTGLSDNIGKVGGYTLVKMKEGKVVFKDKSGKIVGTAVESAKSGIDRLK
jgi:hypothetical protein